MANPSERHEQGGPAVSGEPGGLGATGAFLVVAVVLVVASLVVRRIDDPKWQLRVYVVVIVGLLSSAALRWALVKALLLVAAVGAAMFYGAYRDAVDRGEISSRVAVQRVVNDLTGIRFPPPEASREEGRDVIREMTRDSTRYAPYLEKIDSRNPDINRRASELARGCHAGDHLCETARILAFVTDQVEYRSDPRGGEYIKSPQETLAAMAGDCEDKSILLISLLESLGHHTFMVFTPNHAYALDCYEQELLPLLQDGLRQHAAGDGFAYLADLAPRHNTRALQAALEGAVGLRIRERYCYPLESTQAGSWIGVNNGEHEYVTAFDPVTKKQVQFRN